MYLSFFLHLGYVVYNMVLCLLFFLSFALFLKPLLLLVEEAIHELLFFLVVVQRGFRPGAVAPDTLRDVSHGETAKNPWAANHFRFLCMLLLLPGPASLPRWWFFLCRTRRGGQDDFRKLVEKQLIERTMSPLGLRYALCCCCCCPGRRFSLFFSLLFPFFARRCG